MNIIKTIERTKESKGRMKHELTALENDVIKQLKDSKIDTLNRAVLSRACCKEKVHDDYGTSWSRIPSLLTKAGFVLQPRLKDEPYIYSHKISR